MQELSRRIGPASVDAADPLVRTVAEWQATQGLVSGPSASLLYSGVEEYDSDYYVWDAGESYAPAHKQARIYNLVARASRIGNDGPIDIIVTFKFDGHRASNVAKWTLKRANGDEIRSRAPGEFGSQTDPFLGLTAFGARGWAASAVESDVGCDVVVVGDTRPKAWYEGFWDVDGVSIGITPQGPGGSTTLTKGKRGEVEVGSSLNTYFTCPPSEGGGDGGGYGGGGEDCIVCQQWFLPVGEDWIFEWWECGPAAQSECEGDAT